MDTPQPNLPPHEVADDAAFLAAVEEGIADAEAGLTVPYEDVRRWVLSWGTENELPPPQWQSD